MLQGPLTKQIVRHMKEVCFPVLSKHVLFRAICVTLSEGVGNVEQGTLKYVFEP
jgi:hypothetical protein